MKKFISLALSFALIFAMSPVNFANAAEKEKTITIIHTNDVHGRAEGDDKELIGYAKLKTFYDTTKEKNPNTLLIDAGDTLHGTTFTNISNGKNMMNLMNKIGFDISVPGNHDFNYGYDQLKALANMANFDYLCANVVKKDGKSDFKSSVIKELDGVKVGIFGLSTPETKYKSSPKNTKDVDFKDYIKTAKEQVDLLKKDGAQVIIAVTHLGIDKSSKERSDILAESVPGIDVIIDGHSHSKLDSGMKAGNTLIAQTGEHLKNIGVVNIKLDDGKITDKTAKLVEFGEASKLKADETILNEIKKLNEENKPLLAQKIGKTANALEGEREKVRTGETNLGNLITDAMKTSVGADVAITNGGGIRASIKGPDITMGDILTAFPFTNFVVEIEVTGSDIKAALEHGVSKAPETVGAFPHVSGINFEYDSSKPAGSRIGKVLVNGEALDEAKTYKLATNDFMAIGGDEYTMFAGKKKLAENALLSDVLCEFIKAQPNATVDYKSENRVVDTAASKEQPKEKPAPSENKPASETPEKTAPAQISISNHKIMLNNTPVTVPAYNIDGFNYFMLRDISAALKDTNAKFEVGFDSAKKIITVTSGKSGDAEISKTLAAPKDACESKQILMINGKQNSDIKAYLVNSNNYFKLADLAKALGFKADWDANTKTIILITNTQTEAAA